MKTHTTKALWLSVGISLGLHALLFVAWLNHEEKITPIYSATHTINVQLVDAAQSQRESQVTQKKSTSLKKTYKKNTLSKQHEAAIVQENNPNDVSDKIEAQTSQSATRVKRNFDKLYQLLYAAIDQQKHYPVTALRMQQRGTVRVAFKLFNNGNMNEIAISESSGYNSLDRAALQAVKRIQPFHPATDHIASVKDFQVDIIFQL